MSNKGMSAMEKVVNKPYLSPPRLRFPAFNKPWANDPLSKVLTEHKLKNINGRDVFSVSMESGIVNQVEHLGRSFAASDTSNYNLGRRFDVVYTKSPLKAFPFGIVKQCKFEGEVALSPLYGVFAPVNPHIGLLVEAYFESPVRSKTFLAPLCQKGAKNTIQITNTTFLSGRLPLPTEPKEQTAIANCLSSLDVLIELESQRLEALEAYKHSFMRQIFPRSGETIPRLRFPMFRRDPEWISATLGEIAKVQSGGTPARTNPAYWKGKIPWVTTSLIDSSTILKADEYITKAGLEESSAKIFPKGTLLMAMYGQGKTRGKVAMLGIDAATNQACAAIILKRKGIATEFLFQNLASRYDEIRKISNSGGQENLSAGLIEGISFSFPKNESEQIFIIKALSAVDELISAQDHKVNTLRTHKAGLLQQLFPMFDGKQA